MTSTNGVHTADHAIPPLDAELEGLFEDLAAIQDPGIDQILSGLRLILLSQHSVDRTQTLIAGLAGAGDGTHAVAVIGAVIARLATASTNPSLLALEPGQQKLAQLHGETTAYALARPSLAQFASDTCAAIDGA